VESGGKVMQRTARRGGRERAREERERSETESEKRQKTGHHPHTTQQQRRRATDNRVWWVSHARRGAARRWCVAKLSWSLQLHPLPPSHHAALPLLFIRRPSSCAASPRDRDNTLLVFCFRSLSSPFPHTQPYPPPPPTHPMGHRHRRVGASTRSCRRVLG